MRFPAKPISLKPSSENLQANPVLRSLPPLSFPFPSQSLLLPRRNATSTSSNARTGERNTIFLVVPASNPSVRARLKGSCDFAEIARKREELRSYILYPSTTINVFYTFIAHEMHSSEGTMGKTRWAKVPLHSSSRRAKWTMPPPLLPPSLLLLSLYPPAPSTESNSNTT